MPAGGIVLPNNSPERLSLRIEQEVDACRVELDALGLGFRHSFVSGELARRARQPRQALLRACRDRRRRIRNVLDVTAGWGADSLTLACHGLRVTLLERHPQVHAVLAQALADLAANGQHEIAQRLHLLEANAVDFLSGLEPGQVFDCIYLDPMFPAHKSGAKPGKEMQILQAVTENVDIERCFELALGWAGNRVVVKRPARAPRLDAREPDLILREKTVRFDVYLTHRDQPAG